LIAGLILFFKTKTFKLYVKGVTALIIAITIFLLFYGNRNLATKGKYESFEIRNINWNDDGFFLNIGFNMW
jgi:hypothetical protein